MAFRFNWPDFDADFCNEAKAQLETALNKGTKPRNIVDHISVTQLNMGTTAPDLEILEVGELSTDKFRGMFKLTYAGDASLVIQTKVQANPMHKKSDLPRHTRPVLAADQPLIVPILLRISELKLTGIIVLVVSGTKGITLVFKNDPFTSIKVGSTFDSVTSVRSYLQREIEEQLRVLLREDLPSMIHNLSKRHLQKKNIYIASGVSSPTDGSIPITAANLSTLNELYGFEQHIHEETTCLPKQLAHLTTVHYTLSPFSHIIDHATFRSIPHDIKHDLKHKKTSKRRIIRWNSTT